tara:strand:- start:1435 stop:1605 length:171 start_codon:yes stop_codon:yes gene_type:complete
MEVTAENLLQWVLNHLGCSEVNLLEQYQKLSSVEQVRLRAILYRLTEENSNEQPLL